MRADAFPLESVLSERQQWVVPVYQRHYEWETGEDKQIPKLWEDLKEEALERLENRTTFPHYFGAIIYSEPESQVFGAVRRRFLVDGQQRITTFQLVLAALREVARERKSQRHVDVINAYLFNEKSASMVDADRERFKLWPSQYDRVLYQHISQHTPEKLRSLQARFFYKNGKLIKGQAPNLLRAFWHLYESIDAFVEERVADDSDSPETVIEALLAGFLSGFQLVLIQLGPQDDAQEIFASLNGLGKPLSPFDLIRNEVFHRARKTGEDDEKLFNERWAIFEKPFWTEEVRQGRFKRARADHLVAHAVIAETGREVNIGKIATEYQRYARERAFPTVAGELDVLLRHASTYSDMESSKPTDNLARISALLKIWDLSTFHPFVLCCSAKDVEETTKVRLFELLEAYIVRREICGLTTKNYNKVAPNFVREIIDSSAPTEAFTAYLKGLVGDASRMPLDVQIVEATSRRASYREIPTPRLRYILQQIEYGLRTKFDEVAVSTSNLTIEHIMPQKWAKHWPLPSGENVPKESVFELAMAAYQVSDGAKAQIESRQRLVDTLGNLTLLTKALNPSVGRGAWETKRVKFNESLLALNRGVGAIDIWDEVQIEKRAKKLADVANRIWSWS